MKSIHRLSILCAVFLLLLGVPGCFKMKQAVTLFPDGSGKIVLNVSMKKGAACGFASVFSTLPSYHSFHTRRDR